MTTETTRAVAEYRSTNGRWGVRVRLPAGVEIPPVGSTIALPDVRFVSAGTTSGLRNYDALAAPGMIAVLGGELEAACESDIQRLVRGEAARWAPDSPTVQGEGGKLVWRTPGLNARIDEIRAASCVEVVLRMDLQSSKSVTLLHCRPYAHIRVWGYKRRRVTDLVIGADGSLSEPDPWGERTR